MKTFEQTSSSVAAERRGTEHEDEPRRGGEAPDVPSEGGRVRTRETRTHDDAGPGIRRQPSRSKVVPESLPSRSKCRSRRRLPTRRAADAAANSHTLRADVNPGHHRDAKRPAHPATRSVAPQFVPHDVSAAPRRGNVKGPARPRAAAASGGCPSTSRSASRPSARTLRASGSAAHVAELVHEHVVDHLGRREAASRQLRLIRRSGSAAPPARGHVLDHDAARGVADLLRRLDVVPVEHVAGFVEEPADHGIAHDRGAARGREPGLHLHDERLALADDGLHRVVAGSAVLAGGAFVRSALDRNLSSWDPDTSRSNDGESGGTGMNYRVFGKSGLKVSEVSFGAGHWRCGVWCRGPRQVPGRPGSRRGTRLQFRRHGHGLR